MVMPEHVCPYGRKTVFLLKKHGYDVDDHHLRSREETDTFKREYSVSTTPQTFINDERIGGYDDLRSYFGMKVRKKDETSYRPVITIFAGALFIALMANVRETFPNGWFAVISDFVSITMILLALQKVRNVETFSTMFLNYDVLAQRWIPYAYLYPYGELAAGVLMFGHLLPLVSIPIALFIGSVGAWSVFKAVYLEKRELKCACVGGDSTVPLGFVSLTENLMMIAMALSMLFSHVL